MGPLAIAALIAAGTAAVDLGGNIWANIGGGRRKMNSSEIDSQSMSPGLRELWRKLSESEKQAIMSQYYTEENGWANAGGIFGNDREVVDVEALIKDLERSVADGGMLSEYAALGSEPVFEDYLNSARDAIAAENASMYADLDRLRDINTASFNNELANMSDSFNNARSSLLSQQYQQNAQLMDTLQSGMERSRRNALESGASAGIRIADNINTLLTTQNKQSAASMETANQLAQMMVNQRAAESDVRSRYANMLSEDTSKRHDINLSSESRATSLANTNYNSAYNSYDVKRTALDNKYGAANSLYNVKDTLYGKSKYSGGN